ncbi:hypothetical protein [Pseudooceanicola nitratireducens]|uniref:hypothetical protein n=1 Tax=Pseudooceanicola nitratireducens TaxID=517719 RepID=UPI001C94265C|nr:hypothetical protein [Pseudooceanicola nitratireducens]MBY6158485.1 hypothetical protein [Pseudooceanicola nitratireducens]
MASILAAGAALWRGIFAEIPLSALQSFANRPVFRGVKQNYLQFAGFAQFCARNGCRAARGAVFAVAAHALRENRKLQIPFTGEGWVYLKCIPSIIHSAIV